MKGVCSPKKVFVRLSYEFILKVPKSTVQYQILKSRCCFNQENCLDFFGGQSMHINYIHFLSVYRHVKKAHNSRYDLPTSKLDNTSN